MQGGNKGLRRGIKGTQAEEENKRLMVKIKRCRQCPRENKHMRGDMKCEGVK